MNHGLIRRRIDHIVLDRGRRLVRFVVHTEIVNLHPEVQLLVALEHHRLTIAGGNPGADFGRANHKASRAHVLGRHRLHQIGHDQRRSLQPVIREIGNLHTLAPGSHPVPVHIFYHDIHAIAPGAQWNRLPVNLRTFRRLGQQLGWNIRLHRIFKGLCDVSGQCRNPAKNVDHTALHSVFVYESDVTVFQLHGEGNEHGIAGHFDKIRAHIKRHQVDADLMPDHFLQILELHRWRGLQLGELLQAVELFARIHRGSRSRA